MPPPLVCPRDPLPQAATTAVSPAPTPTPPPVVTVPAEAGEGWTLPPAPSSSVLDPTGELKKLTKLPPPRVETNRERLSRRANEMLRMQVPDRPADRPSLPIPSGPGGLAPGGVPVAGADAAVGMTVTLDAENAPTKVEVQAGAKVPGVGSVGVSKSVPIDK